MPQQATTAELWAKLGPQAAKAFEEVKGAPVRKDTGGELPAGIEGGIAELREIKLDTYKKGDNIGKVFFYAAGIVVSPEEHNGIRVAGRRTSIMEPLFEGKKPDDPKSKTRWSLKQRIAEVSNYLQLLGVTTKTLNGKTIAAAIDALRQKKGLFFAFRTWKGKKETTGKYAGVEPRVNHVWQGKIDYEVMKGKATAAVEEAPEDETPGDTEEETGEASSDDATTDSEDETPDEEPQADEALEPESDKPDDKQLKALVVKAKAKDKTARNSLLALAVEAGFTQQQAEDADSWDDVAEMILRGATPEEPQTEETPEPEEQLTPEKGDTFMFTPKGVKNAVQCEVVKVYKDDTCDLKNIKTKATYMKVPFSKLSAVGE